MSSKWKFIGYIAAVVPAIILPYYSVIGGWVAKYLFAFVSGSAVATANDAYFGGFISQVAEPVVWFLIYIWFHCNAY